VPFADESFLRKVEERIIRPTINGFETEKIDYRGFVFIGLMNVAGDPFVIEYNVRLGDPETEVVIPRIQSDLVELMHSAASGKLKMDPLIVDDRYALTVMLVSGGYPGAYENGKQIKGIKQVTSSIVYQAGTQADGSGDVLTKGGRVIAVTSMADTIEEARQIVYSDIEKISFEKMNFRKDIGMDLI
jgi:phosphoribosylamine--glycine ligase